LGRDARRIPVKKSPAAERRNPRRGAYRGHGKPRHLTVGRLSRNVKSLTRGIDVSALPVNSHDMGKKKNEKMTSKPSAGNGVGREIKVTCRGADSLPMDTIEEFQGNLKTRTKKDIEKIINSILKYGFTFPFFVWEHEGRYSTIDGHGRITALTELRRKGYDLPPFPVVYIEAANEAEAKEKLLQQNSHYGKITREGLVEFIGDLEIDMEELSLPDITISADGVDTEVKYKEKIELIIECSDETQAAELYGEFGGRGLKCRISTL
jgi:hypothetical protein